MKTVWRSRPRRGASRAGLFSAHGGGTPAAVCGGRAPELQKHIKAVTYHDLAIREVGGALEVTIVFDV
ncbi:MAG TPA: archease [Promineifilum sp.]|nr:archease [Promineifilum sp.]